MNDRDDELATLSGLAIAEELLSRTRHALRNRLSSIQSASIYLKRRARDTPLWDGDPRVPSFFEIIEEEVARAQAIVDEEASTDGMWSRRVAPSALASSVRRALRSARLPEGARLEADLGETADVEIEPTEVALLARCLIEDVAEAMPEGGLLSVRSFQAGDRVVLAIASPASAPADAGRAGLGLAIARRIALKAGAYLTIEPVGSGMAATVSFRASGAKHTLAAPVDREARRLLVVDDDAVILLSLSALLDDAGFAVETSSSLEDAGRRLASTPAFAVVLLDRRLGDHDGLSLVPSIRAAMPAAKIVVWSGDDRPASDVDATLCKGTTFNVLLSHLLEIVGD